LSVDLDAFLPNPALRVAHRRVAAAQPAELWRAAQSVRLADTGLLGRLIRLRIPGTAPELSYAELFRAPPFLVLQEQDGALVSGLVGRIWTIRRDYPELAGPDEFCHWAEPGTARVAFAHWVQAAADGGGGAVLHSETRVAVSDREARVGLRAVRPLIAAFNKLIATEALSVAAQRAERASD
jgi:hypothetical protein